MAVLRVALAQVNVTVGDLDGNRRKILEQAEAARAAGADLVTFPELALSGYPPEDLLLRPQFLHDNATAIADLARDIKGIVAVVGFPDSAGDAVYNAAAVIRDGRVTGVYHKIELPNYGVFDEMRYFAAGTTPLVIEVKGVRAAVTICEDIWVERGPADELAAHDGAPVVLNLYASPFHAGKRVQRWDVVRALARRTRSFVCYNNLVGGQDELVFDGGGLVVDPRGEPMAVGKTFEEDLLVVDIDTDEVQGGPVSEPLSATGSIIEPPNATTSAEYTDEIYHALVLGTRDYVRKNGFSKAVIGLSGGIDSAVTAAAAVDALGKGNVIGVSMPSQYTSSETFADAALVASNLGIALLTVPIQPVFSMYQEALRQPFGEGEPGIEMENLQARIRGNILMALSNRFGWIVLTTGNKSEVATGYCTLYGDMAGGFAVIKDVPKLQVYRLARHINSKAGRDVVPRSVIDRPPTAELKPNQKDSDSLPPYAVLDRVLQLYVEEDASPAELIERGFSRPVVEKIVRMVDRNEYKRRQSAPGVKITPKAFGRDRRLPITNRYRPSMARRSE